jgi:nucleotide-binding universal stress UspA family protein
MIHKILIPLDGSDLAERALVPALQLAQYSEAPISLLRSVSTERVLATDPYTLGTFTTGETNPSLEIARKDALSYLTSLHKSKIKGVEVKLQMREGDPATTIIDVAQEDSTDLIAMSSHGYSGVTRWVLGSVAERVLRAAPCPVFIVRSAQPVRHMLIPLDGSSLSEHILSSAIDAALAFNCKVTFLRSIQSPSVTDVEDLEKIEPGLGRSYVDEIHETASAYLNVFANRYRTRVSDLNLVVIHGSPPQNILDYASLHDVDLIAMSTHGRTGLKRWVYGSVTEKVLHAATRCSMLIVRPEQIQ